MSLFNPAALNTTRVLAIATALVLICFGGGPIGGGDAFCEEGFLAGMEGLSDLRGTEDDWIEEEAMPFRRGRERRETRESSRREGGGQGS